MKTSTLASLALTLGMLVACGGNVSLGSNGGQLQKGAACNSCTGPVQEDARVCPDGTTFGRTCLSNGDGTCGYGFADCPVSNPPAGSKCTTCTGAHTEEAKMCPDGSGVGRECLYRADGTCGYDFPACPGENDGGAAPTDCSAPNACGNDPVPTIAKQCSDGSAVGYSCIRQNNGTCGLGFACPGDVCPNSECSGPQPGAPTVKCSDGSIGGAYCGRQAGGKTCAWTFRECPAIDGGAAPDAN